MKQKMKQYSIFTMLMMLTCCFGISNDSIAKSNTYGYLGVGIENLTKVDKEDLDVEWGVLVTEVVSNSPAEKAGIIEDDVIQYFKGDKIETTSDLVDKVRDTNESEKVQIALIRDGKKKDVYAVIEHKRQRESRAVHWFGDNGGHFEFHADRGYLGVQLHDLDEDLASYFNVKLDEGVLVLKVMEDSPAEKAGLKSGDIIVEIDGETMNEASNVSEIIGEKDPEETVKITVLRHQKKMTLNATLDANQRMKRIMIKTTGDFDTEEIVIPEIDMDMNREKMIIHEENMKDLQEKMKDLKQEIKVKKMILPGTSII